MKNLIYLIALVLVGEYLKLKLNPIWSRSYNSHHFKTKVMLIPVR
jgi:hypothetical protein